LKIKKYISLILIAVMAISSIGTVSANENLHNVSALGLIPQSITQYNMDEAVTREEFAYMTARLLHQPTLQPVSTRFADVDESNPYSGYIEYLAGGGIISGFDDGSFVPKGGLELYAAYKILVSVLGYADLAMSIGGYPEGYIQIANATGLHKSAETRNGYVTKGGSVAMISAALTADMAQNIRIGKDGEFSYNINKDEKRTLLSSVLGFSVYRGIITQANQVNNSVLFTVESNRYDTNYALLTPGDTVGFKVKGNVNLEAYKYAPVTIWVNKDETITYIALQKNVSVKFGCITSINNDSSEDSAYPAEFINSLTLMDDETKYSVIDTPSLRLNGIETSAPVKLTGKMARLVIINDEVKDIQTWDLKEGGLITQVSETSIKYINGDRGELTLRDLLSYKNIYVFIDGRSAGFSEIKKNSVFYYYDDGSELTLVISERNAAGILNSKSDNEIEIEGFWFGIKDAFYSTDGKNYRKNAGFELLLNKIVKAYLAPNGKALFIHIAGSDAQEQQSRFIGFLAGYERKSIDKSNVHVLVWHLAPQIMKKDYHITSKTRFEDGIELEDFLKSAGHTVEATIDDESIRRGIYEFDINAQGNITSVKNPVWFSGYGEKTETDVSTFADVSPGMVTINERVLFFKDVGITLLHKDGDEYMGATANWNELQGRRCSGSKISFFVFSGNENSSVPDLVLLHGDGVGTLGSRYPKLGVASGRSVTVDENGEPFVMLGVYTGASAVKYKVMESIAKTIPAVALISYRDGLKFSKNDIAIESIVNLSGDPSTWDTQEKNTATGLHSGIVTRIDSLRITTKDDNGEINSNFFHPSYNFFIEYNTQNPKNVINNITIDDISVGDRVFYNLSDGIRGVIVIR
jgi:Ca2+-binding EF-hand superfamily protein